MHSSNSIFVVQPSKDESLIAIAKCEATLEAISQATSCIPSLKAALPVYSDLQDAQIPASGEHSSKQALLADTPVSSREYNQAWEELCAFELEGHAWRPTPSLLWRVWRSIVSACTIKGWPLDQPLDVLRLARTVQDDDIPRPILDAVVDRVRADESVSEPGCKSAFHQSNYYPSIASRCKNQCFEVRPLDWTRLPTSKGRFRQLGRF